LFIATAANADCQIAAPEKHPIVSSEAYDRVLDSVFPRDYTHSPKLDYVLILRFEPSFHAESQVVIQTLDGGKVDAWLYTSTSGGIWQTCNDYIERTGREDAAEIARSIHSQKDSIVVSKTKAREWHASLFSSLSQSVDELKKASEEREKTGSMTIVLDGTRYELSYVQGMVELHWEFWDVEIVEPRSTSVSALARWMNGIRKYAVDQIGSKHPGAP
jgi:hypothetical protein